MLRWYGAIFKRGLGKRMDCDCPSVACRLESCTGTITVRCTTMHDPNIQRSNDLTNSTNNKTTKQQTTNTTPTLATSPLRALLINYNTTTEVPQSSTMSLTPSNLILDRPVKATADDAMVAKLATTHAGYYVDPFLDAMIRNPVVGSTGRERPTRAAFNQNIHMGRRRTIQPIIKRGTHARVCVMDRAISTFLKTTTTQTKNIQIVNLGCGKDTSYFRYRNGNIMGMEREDEDEMKMASLEEKRAGAAGAAGAAQEHIEHEHEYDKQIHWYEVDHKSVIKEKASLIQNSNLLSSYCPQLIKTKNGYECKSTTSVAGTGDSSSCDEPASSSSSSSFSSYHLVGHDLRESPAKLLEKLNLDPTLPTLYIMECVSMYVPILASEKLLQAISVSADSTYFACYEPILDSNSSNSSNSSSDPFGRVMEQNLVKIGVASPECCLLRTRTLKDQLEKLIDCGFVRAVGCDMWSAYETIVTDAQRKRANQSEFLDEYEEWVLIMRHYCFVVARGGRSSDLHQHNQDINDTNQENIIDLTTILDHKDEKSSSLGWMLGKCLELEKSKE
jgi:O-methyltransferase involved in polyketide biosynthesis